MAIVDFGYEWIIETKEDFDKAMKTIEENEFCARMSDDFRREQIELMECLRQKKSIFDQAKDKKIF